MVDVSNLKINERSDKAWLNLRVTKIGNKIEIIDLFQWANMKISKIASSSGYRKEEQFQNC